MNIKLKSGTIEFIDVSFHYNNINLFSKLNIVIPEGIIIALYGPSGTGKSTFVKLIFDILQPKSGKILIDGHNIDKISTKTIKKYIFYLPQNTAKLFSKTIYENIIYGHENNKEMKNYIKHICVKYNIVNIFSNISNTVDSKDKFSFLKFNVGKLGEFLSGGQKQIIHIIRCILNKESKIVILDEPTNSLDSSIKASIFSLITHLNDQGKTILIITHDPFIKNRCKNFIYFHYNKNPVLDIAK